MAGPSLAHTLKMCRNFIGGPGINIFLLILLIVKKSLLLVSTEKNRLRHESRFLDDLFIYISVTEVLIR